MVRGKRVFLLGFLCLFLAIVLLSFTRSPAYSQITEKIIVQAQKKDDFIRIIFRSSTISKFEVSLVDNKININFGKSFSADFSSLKNDLAEYLDNAVINPDKVSMTLEFKDSDFELRKFKSKKFAGVDVLLNKNFIAKKGGAEKNADLVANKENGTKTGKSADSKIGAVKGIRTKIAAPIPIIKPFKNSAQDNTKNQQDASANRNFVGPLPAKKISSALYRTPLIKPDSFKELHANIIGPKLPIKNIPSAQTSNTTIAVVPEMPKTPEEAWKGEKALTWDDGSSNQTDEEKENAIAEEKPKIQAVQLFLLPGEIIGPKPEVKKVEVVATEEVEDDGLEYTMSLKTESLSDGIKITFPWTKRTAATIYKRSGNIWAIFNTHEVINTKKIVKTGFFVSADQIYHKDYTILRMKLSKEAEKLNLGISKSDFAWLIELSKKEQPSLDFDLPIKFDLDSLVTKVILQTPEGSEPLKLLDPLVGDRLVIIPFFREKTGVAPEREFVDFSILHTMQGLAIALKSDETTVAIKKTGTIITKTGGIHVYSGNTGESQSTDYASAERRLQQIHSLFPFVSSEFDRNIPLMGQLSNKKNKAKEETAAEAKTGNEENSETEDAKEEENSDDNADQEEAATNIKDKKEDEKKFSDIRKELLADIINTDDTKQKNDKRIRLAKFYFSNQLYTEAAGVLDTILVDDPKINSNSFLSLSGASFYMMGRYQEAAKIFEELAKKFKTETGLEEIKLWWWASNYQIRPKSLQNTADIPTNFFENYEGFISEYPPNLKYKLGLLAAEYKIEKNKFADAKGIIELVNGKDVPKNFVNSARFLEASIMEKEGFIDEAVTIWKELSDDVFDRYNRARSTFAMYKTLYTADKVDKEETIKQLDRLRIVWKGDDFELELLKFLGGLYIYERDFINGLRTWRELVTEFPKSQESLLIARQMKKTFIDLFDKGVAYELDPFAALTIYFEFRELTPVGEVGDKIVRQLVDHFVKADLLENAAALLSHQVRFRSSGVEQIKLALKLADIQLTNKRPDLTIQALDFIKNKDLTPELKNEAKYLRARALLKMDKHYETLQLLADDWSKDAQSLRLEIFLQKQNWFGIMNITEPRLAEVIDRGNPIKDGSLKDLLLLSIAYATQQEHEKLEILKKEFSDKIEDQNGRTIFAFVTNDKGGVNYMDFSNTVQLEDISGFVTNYLFWPSREWASVVQILEAKINTLGKGSTLSQDESNQIIQLAIAYTMQIKKNENPETIKSATKGLKRLQREFAQVQIDERSLPVFMALTQDADLIPEEALKTPTSIKNIETFVDSYKQMFDGKNSLL